MAKVLMIRLMRQSGPLSEDGGDEALFDHKALARSLPALDRLVADAGLPPLSGFVSEDPENVYDSVDDEDEAEELIDRLPPVRWSRPSDALPTVTGLIERLGVKATPAGIKDAAKVRAELRDVETVLRTGAAKRATFRFYHEF